MREDKVSPHVNRAAQILMREYQAARAAGMGRWAAYAHVRGMLAEASKDKAGS